MGVYDIYGKEQVQLKVGPCEMNGYDIGDTVPLNDGIYVGYEGFVIIHEGKVLRVDTAMIDKWGNFIDPEVCLSNNPLQKVVDEIAEKYKDKKTDESN